MSTVEEIVQGKGKFIDDFVLPGMQHMAVVRSNYSRGKIIKLKGGYTFKDFPAYMASVGEGATEGEKGLIEPVLADKYVNYIGEPMAVVLGKDRYDAEDRTEDVEVEIEPLPPMMDPEKSLEAWPPSIERILIKRNPQCRACVKRDFTYLDSKYAGLDFHPLA